MDQRRGRDRGSVLAGEVAHPLLTPESSSATRLCLLLPWLAAGTGPRGSRGACRRHGSQCGLSVQRVAVLRPTCLESRAPSPSSARDHGPSFSPRRCLHGGEPAMGTPPLVSDRRTHPGETHRSVQTFHMHPRSPTFPFRPLQLGNEAGITAKTKGPLSVIISEATSN